MDLRNIGQNHVGFSHEIWGSCMFVSFNESIEWPVNKDLDYASIGYPLVNQPSRNLIIVDLLIFIAWWIFPMTVFSM